jgi:hypothetical protein
MTDSIDNTETAEDAPARIERVERTGAGELVVYLAGRKEPHKDACVARCFPWTLPDTYLSVRDKNGKEIALLKSLDELPDHDSREVIEGQLREMIFNPKIRRVLEWKHEFGVTRIRCETDRGEVTFQIRSREDVRILSPIRALLRDVDGNTYELADLSQLDPASQKHFMHFF